MMLCPCSKADVDVLLNHWTNPLIRRYLFDDQIIDQTAVMDFILASQATFEELQFGLWMLTDKSTGEFRGVCGCTEKDGTPDLVFSIEPEYWGKGLAQESANRALTYLSNTIGLQKIIATVDKPNTNSIRVLEKLGMRLQEEKLVEGNLILCYTLIANEDKKN